MTLLVDRSRKTARPSLLLEIAPTNVSRGPSGSLGAGDGAATNRATAAATGCATRRVGENSGRSRVAVRRESGTPHSGLALGSDGFATVGLGRAGGASSGSFAGAAFGSMSTGAGTTVVDGAS